MSVASWCSTCFLCCSVFLFVYGPFRHGALKLDMSTLFTTFFLWTSIYIIKYYPKHDYSLLGHILMTWFRCCTRSVTARRLTWRTRSRTFWTSTTTTASPNCDGKPTRFSLTTGARGSGTSCRQHAGLSSFFKMFRPGTRGCRPTNGFVLRGIHISLAAVLRCPYRCGAFPDWPGDMRTHIVSNHILILGLSVDRQ